MVKLYFCIDGTTDHNGEPVIIILDYPPVGRHVAIDTIECHMNISKSEIAKINNELAAKKESDFTKLEKEIVRLNKKLAEAV